MVRQRPDYAEIRRLRDLGLSQAAIGEKVGLSQSTICEILRRNPETAEQRAFRRFPIAAHKPGGF